MVLFLNTLIVVIILALRLLPNDDILIRMLLLPLDGCVAPCFINIPAESLLVRITISEHSSQTELWLSRVEIESSNAKAVSSLAGYSLPSFAKFQGHS